MLSKPLGSAASLTGANSPTAAFTPDVAGTYRVRLSVNNASLGEVDTRLAIVRDANGLRIPAWGEATEANYTLAPGVLNDQGYWPDLAELLNVARELAGPEWIGQVVGDLEAYGSDDGLTVGSTARLRSGNEWICDSVDASSSVWTPRNKIWDIRDQDIRSLSGSLTTQACGGFYQGFMRFGEDASAWAEANGGHGTVFVPPGLWGTQFTINAFPFVNYWIEGEIRYMNNHSGGLFWIRQADNPHDIRIYGGGTLNANFIGNDNALAIGQGDGQMAPYNIMVEGITIKNCRHVQQGTGDTGVSTFGNGGGKGITLQFGSHNIVIASSVYIDNCDIGFSAEGIVGLNPPADALQTCRVDATVTNCRVGAFIFSNQDNHYTNSLELNCTFHNCGVRGGTEPIGDFQDDPISDHFGIICATDVLTVNGRIHVFNDQYASEDPVTIIKGVLAGCNLEIFANVYRLKDAIDHRFWDGFPGSPPKPHEPSEANQFKMHLVVADATGMEYLIRSDPTYMPVGNVYDIAWRMQAGTTGYPGTALIDLASVNPSSNRIKITRLSNSLMETVDNRLRIGDGTTYDYVTDWALSIAPAAAAATTQRMLEFRSGGFSRHGFRCTAGGSLQFTASDTGVNWMSAQNTGNLFVGSATTNLTLQGNVFLPVVTDATRGTATLGRIVFNTDDNAPNYGDGTNWRDAAGVIT